MDWRIEAKGMLYDYEARRTALGNIPEEIRRLKLAYEGIRSAVTDGTPVRGGGSGREDAMLSNIATREKLARNLETSRLWVENVDRALASLTEEERRVLDAMYIHRQRAAAPRLAEELGVEERSVYYRRDRALRRFTIAMYGAVES